jgi:ribosomal protein S18 acetylase RimI-like enzyme
MSEPEVREATARDLDSLVDIYRSTQEWLATKGTDQWSRNTPDKVRAGLSTAVGNGECFVAELNGKLVGMITVDGFADPEFWSELDQPHDALYVHRMVVDRAASGMNIGGLLLNWAEGIAAKAGKSWLRLDAWRTNKSLHSYYQRQGFAPVRIVDLSHRGSGALFQRPVHLKSPVDIAPGSPG